MVDDHRLVYNNSSELPRPYTTVLSHVQFETMTMYAYNIVICMHPTTFMSHDCLPPGLVHVSVVYQLSPLRALPIKDYSQIQQ